MDDVFTIKDTWTKYKEDTRKLNDIELRLRLYEFNKELIKQNAKRKNPNRQQGDNMAIRNLKRKIAFIHLVEYERSKQEW